MRSKRKRARRATSFIFVRRFELVLLLLLIGNRIKSVARAVVQRVAQAPAHPGQHAANGVDIRFTAQGQTQARSRYMTIWRRGGFASNTASAGQPKRKETRSAMRASSN